MPLTDDALPLALRRWGLTGPPTNRERLLAAAADRLEALAAENAALRADEARLDFLEAARPTLAAQEPGPSWVVLRPGWTWWFNGATAREAIDAAMKRGKGDADV